jgi:glutamate synthase (NADPH/NADH) small chain
MSVSHQVQRALTRELRPPLAPAEALLEADRCLGCGGSHAPAPCFAACPADVDVPGFVGALADGDRLAAARTIFAENLLGGTCARVCPVEVLCEGACVLRRPIAIASLQRFATDAALLEREPTVLRERAAANGRRVAVVGAGPAGMVCAGELAALGYAVTVHDEHREPGGLVRYAIAPYREQAEPLPEEAAALAALGVAFRLGEHVEAAELDYADAVFLAVGLGADVAVSYPGDDLTGVWRSLPFIEALKTGAPPRIGRDVVVIGGGNTAMDCAREALRLGAELVTVVYRRTRDAMPAYAHEVDEAEAEGVRFQYLAEPARFLGTHHLEGVECRLTTLGEPDSSGRRRPVPVEGTEFTIRADTAIEAIGQRARTELADRIEGLVFDHGALEIDPETGQTSNPRFFAGGDLTSGGAGVVEAVRDGKRAARAIDGWLTCAA